MDSVVNYRQPHACDRCGRWIASPNPRGRPQKFCSKTCKNGSRQLRTYDCQHCGESWETISGEGQPPRYCSDECRRGAASRRASEWFYDNPERVAVQPSRQPERRSVMFSEWAERTGWDGAAAVAEWRRANPDRVKAHNMARYARTRGSHTAEHFTLDEIYDRDAGWCYLCQTDCVRSDASVDHVIPVCPPHHGPHTRANVKLAHLSCNARKGRKLLSELPWYTPPP